ncbi:MAG: type I restriction-modification system subunit M [Clostridiales bacterium]|jgi:type I restriction enzyme M protein|nr:type I restriction-modification system subunit M [Clostridiales bacterium]
MQLRYFVKRLQDIMRNDAGINGDAQRIEQMVWLLFLKVYDAKDRIREARDPSYNSIIPAKFRWRNWAADKKNGTALTGKPLLDFVNNELFPALKGLDLDESAPMSQLIVKTAFEDNNNYMKDGTLLREVINSIDEVAFKDYRDRHAFGEIYETILVSLQNAGNAGEFYTPRAVTDFMSLVVAPKLGERVADFACGTGGFLTSAIKVLEGQVKNKADKALLNSSIFGVEKKALPHLLCVTNLLLHDIDSPSVVHGNSLTQIYGERFDVILMNPPFGGSEKEEVKSKFPPFQQSSDTADLFMVVIMNRLKKGGRAAVIIPDGFLFGSDNAKVAIKTQMLTEFNLHTVVRMPHDIFAPYTNITTNILFFDNTGPTAATWFYRLDMPEGYKHFSKKKPMLLDHFQPAMDWWADKKEIRVNGFDKAKLYNVKFLLDRNCNLDLCGIPREEKEVGMPEDILNEHEEEKRRENALDERLLSEMRVLLRSK